MPRPGSSTLPIEVELLYFVLSLSDVAILVPPTPTLDTLSRWCLHTFSRTTPSRAGSRESYRPRSFGTASAGCVLGKPISCVEVISTGSTRAERCGVLLLVGDGCWYWCLCWCLCCVDVPDTDTGATATAQMPLLVRHCCHYLKILICSLALDDQQ